MSYTLTILVIYFILKRFYALIHKHLQCVEVHQVGTSGVNNDTLSQ